MFCVCLLFQAETAQLLASLGGGRKRKRRPVQQQGVYSCILLLPCKAISHVAEEEAGWDWKKLGLIASVLICLIAIAAYYFLWA